jgi:hypothetical protein
VNISKSEINAAADREMTRRMIEYTLREAHKLGDNVCVYFLNSALEALEDSASAQYAVAPGSITRLN